jgi:nucleotide-binding universal stress UspA family protein
MKKILVATDFSPAAENAARYALHLAYYLQVNIELLHTFEVPVIASEVGAFNWSSEDYENLKGFKIGQLSDLTSKLDKEDREVRPDFPWIPQISYSCEEVEVFKTIGQHTGSKDTYFLTMGASSKSGIKRFFFGSKVLSAVHKTGLPVLIVPPMANFKKINKIAFATDFSGNDLEILHALSGLARPFNAEILIAHVTEGNVMSAPQQKNIESFLKEVTAKANYPKIYYRHLSGMNVEEGLTWLIDHGHIDLLSMVHRPHDLFDQIFNGSHTMKMAEHTSLPMLIFTETASLSGFMSDCL